MRRGWPRKTLEQLINDGVVELGRGKVISKKDLLNFPGNYPVYSSAKNNEGKFGEYGKFMFDEELITWSVDGGGAIFHRRKHKFSITNVGGYIRIKKLDVICYSFLYYCLSFLHSKIQFDWVKKAHPSVIRRLYKDIPLPPIPEQKRIVAILDEAFAGIATAVANTEKNLANARELFESYLNAVFSQQGDGWSVKTVGEIADHCLGKMLDKRKNKGVLRPYLRNLNVQWFDIDITDILEMRIEDVELERYQVKQGDLLICEGGYPGRAAIWRGSEPMFFQKALHRVRCHEPVYNRWLLYYLYLADETGALKPYFTGAGIQHFTGKALKEFRLPVAPPEEAEAIVASMEELREETQYLELIHRRKLAALSELKQSLLQKAFSGELTAVPQDEIEDALA